MPTTTSLALDQQITISVYLRRDMHDNGMTLQEYTDAVVAGTQPILDHDEYVYQFGAVADELNLVTEWAGANNLTVVESGLGTASVKLLGTAEQYNALFDIQLEQVVDGSRTYITHSGNITIPGEINSVVQAVLGLDNSASFTHDAILDSNGPVDIENLPPSLDPNVISYPTPVDLALAYQFPRAAGTDLVQGSGTCVGIIELGGGWTTQNLTSTFTRIGQPNPTVVDVSVDGGVNDGGVDVGSSGEVMLDIYCVGAVAPAATIAMYFAPNSLQGFVDTISTAANDTVNNPSVLSISWGTVDTYWNTPARLAFDTNLQAAIVKGINTFVAIGDYGTQGVSGSATYTVQYPGTSPYAISAGGTVISVNTDHTIASEIAWKSGSSYATGGGYSSIYSIPSWQTGKSFSYKTYPAGTVTSLTTRGVPDMSAMATGYQFYYGAANYTGTFLGTSAVAPLLAGMMARINSITGRRNGFINPIVYENQSAFNDITTGNNAAPAAVGYSATAGWDACTGLGSPIGTAILALFTTPTSALTSTVAVSYVSLTTDQAATPFIPVTASGGTPPYVFSISPTLPTGLAINTGSGSISGTPTVAHSTSSFAVTVTDTLAATSSTSFALAVKAPGLTATVSASYITLDRYSTMISTRPVVGSGGYGTLSYSITPSLPMGLSFNTNGSISGNPSELYPLQYHNVIISDSASQIVSRNFGLEVKQEVILTLSSPTIALQIGKSLSGPITPATVTGGVGTKTFSISPALPAGLSFSPVSGQITGRPTVSHATSVFTVTVTDSPIYSLDPSSDSVTFTLEVVSLPLLLSTPRHNLVEIFGKPIDPFNPITITSGNSPYSWAITPALPTGISFGSTGTIYGTPSESLGPRVTSTYHTITVTDASSQVRSEVVRLKLSRDNVILSDDCNYIRDYFFEFAGTTSTGYGANLKGKDVQDGDIIQAANWDNLLLDTDRILVHQNGVSDNIIPSANTGTKILASVPDRMYTAAQFLEINKETVHPSQLAVISHNTPVSITEDWTCTNYVTTASMILGSSNNGYITSVNWAWEYEQQINYFFNLGSTIVPDITIVGGRQKDIDGWRPVVDEINSVSFGKAEFLEALQTEDLSWEYIAIGEGNTNNPAMPKGPITDDYKTNGIILRYQIVGSTIIGSVHYLVGLGKKKKGKKKKWGKKTKKGFIHGEWVRVSLYVETDFKTTYIVGNNGGISSQKPQTQLISNYVSASPSPLAEFSFATGLSDAQVVTLNNNSTFTCVVSNIVLEGYTTGTVTPTSLTIPPHSNDSFAIQYTGTTPGYYKGSVRVLQNVNPLTLFTEVNVGSVSPSKLITTVTNTSIIAQDFLVDHRGGDYNKFEVAFPATNPAGFTYLDIVENSQDTFRVVFDPTVTETNGTFQTTATVTIYPLDSSLDLINLHVPISITTNVIFYQGLGNWVSALGYDNSCLGLTYDIIGGVRYLTVGIGYGEDLSIDDLQTENPTGWETIYRIPINKGIASEILYTNDYLVSDVENIGNYFGIGNATGSILTVKNYRGNLEIDLNILSTDSSDPHQQKVLEGLEGAFYYYDETLYRNSQLASPNESGQTEYFTGFDVHGNTITDLVAANIV
jgi:kumamolisin